MSNGNFLLGTVKGKLGDIVLSRTNGKQVQRTYIAHPNNPKTDGQMKQRSLWSIGASAFSGSDLKFYPNSSLTKYAEWQKKNTNAEVQKYWQSLQEKNLAKQNGYVAYDEWILSDGNLTQSVLPQITAQTSATTLTCDNALTCDFLTRHYLDLIGEEETAVNVPFATIIKDWLEENFGSMYIHPVIAFGEVISLDPLGVVGQSDFLAFNYIHFAEFVAEDLSETTTVRLQANSAKTAIDTVGTATLNVSSKYGQQIVCSGNSGGAGTDAHLNFTLSALPTAHADRFALWKRTFVCKKVGGKDCQRVQISEDDLTATLPYSYKYPRMRGQVNVDAEYIANWLNSIDATDGEVLTE